MRNAFLLLLALFTVTLAGTHLFGFDGGINVLYYSPFEEYNHTIEITPTASTSFRYRFELMPWIHLQSALRLDRLEFYTKTNAIDTYIEDGFMSGTVSGTQYYQLKATTLTPELALRFNKNFSQTALFCGGGIGFSFPLFFEETTLIGIWSTDNTEGTTPNVIPHFSGGITFRPSKNVQFSIETRYRIWLRSLGEGLYKDSEEKAKGITVLFSTMWRKK